MPMVGKKKFPYTAAGKKAAEKYAKKEGYASAKGMKMHESKESKAMEAKEKKMKRMK
jgi:hypothetical protein